MPRTRAWRWRALAAAVALASAASTSASAAAATCDVGNAVALPAPQVPTIMAAPTNASTTAWILYPNCTREILVLAPDVDDALKLNCSEKGIGRIESLPSAVQRLYFDSNPVTEFDFSTYTAMNHLILAWCELTTVEGFKFPASLRELDFEGNQLQGIAKGLIPNRVEYLYLGENDLDNIDDFALPTSLTDLFLKASKFTSINFAIPEGLKTLDMNENSQLRSIENLTMPNSLTTLSCQWCGLEVFRGVQLSTRLTIMNFTGATLTDFEIRKSDVNILKEVEFFGNVSQPTCPDPGATRRDLSATLAVCVLSDAAFEAKYPNRVLPAPRRSSGSASSNSPTTVLPVGPAEPPSSPSAVVIIVIAAVVCIVCAALAVFGYRKCLAGKTRQEDDADKYQDASTLDAPGSTAATVRSGSFAPHEYLANDIRNDPTLITYRIAYNEIDILHVIARGGFGVIHLGKFRGQEVAVKRILPEKAKDTNVIRSFMDEIRLCASLEHPRIVEFIGVSWSTLQDVAVVIEFMGGGDLHAVLRAQRSPRATSWFEPSPDLKAKSLLALDVADALVYLHSFEQPIIHRDLKTRNVLLNDVGDAKLSDFGISREAALDETMTGEIGTVAWIAPEVLRGERYSEKADIYSLGVLLVELDTASHPYRKELSESETTPQSNTRIALLVSTGKLSPSTSLECPSDVAALVSRCLRFAPSDRPTAMDVHYELRKIWQQRPSGPRLSDHDR